MSKHNECNRNGKGAGCQECPLWQDDCDGDPNYYETDSGEWVCIEDDGPYVHEVTLSRSVHDDLDELRRRTDESESEILTRSIKLHVAIQRQLDKGVTDVTALATWKKDCECIGGSCMPFIQNSTHEITSGTHYSLRVKDVTAPRCSKCGKQWTIEIL